MKTSLNAVIATFKKVLAIDVESSTRIGDDVDVDSVDILEVITSLEQQYAVKVDDSDLYQLETVADIADLLDALRR